MEQTKCNKNEIKTIIDDLRELIEIHGCNYSERTINIFKKTPYKPRRSLL